MKTDIITAILGKRGKYMKKLISLALCGAMLFAMASCSAVTDETTKKTRDTEQADDEDGRKNNGDETTADNTTVEVSVSDTTVQVLPTGDIVVFSTTDRNGQTYDNSIFADHELTMINFWEPWCGPCVSEMSDIEKLYEDYKDEGLLVIGVYSETSMESEVDDILSSCKTSYPILTYTNDFDKYQSGYVPTTIFVDKNGNVIDTGSSFEGMDSTLIVGSKSYKEWESLVKRYLGN